MDAFTGQVFIARTHPPPTLPRTTDAMYAPRFLLLLHQLDVPGFPSLRCFDLLIRALAPLVFSATDQEVCINTHVSVSLYVCVRKRGIRAGDCSRLCLLAA